MRTRMVAVPGLLLVLAASTAYAQLEFKTYASAAGRYKVLFPGAVKTEVIPVKTEKAELKVTVESVELRAGTSFLVTFVDAPDDIAKQEAKPRLDKVRDGNKGLDGKVTEDKELTVGTEKYPARDILIEKAGGFLRNRIVIVGPRVYQVMVQGPKDVVTSASADKFLESFEVTK